MLAFTQFDSALPSSSPHFDEFTRFFEELGFVADGSGSLRAETPMLELGVEFAQKHDGEPFVLVLAWFRGVKVKHSGPARVSTFPAIDSLSEEGPIIWSCQLPFESRSTLELVTTLRGLGTAQDFAVLVATRGQDTWRITVAHFTAAARLHPGVDPWIGDIAFGMPAPFANDNLTVSVRAAMKEYLAPRGYAPDGNGTATLVTDTLVRTVKHDSETSTVKSTVSFPGSKARPLVVKHFFSPLDHPGPWFSEHVKYLDKNHKPPLTKKQVGATAAREAVSKKKKAGKSSSTTLLSEPAVSTEIVTLELLALGAPATTSRDELVLLVREIFAKKRARPQRVVVGVDTQVVGDLRWFYVWCDHDWEWTRNAIEEPAAKKLSPLVAVAMSDNYSVQSYVRFVDGKRVFVLENDGEDWTFVNRGKTVKAPESGPSPWATKVRGRMKTQPAWAGLAIDLPDVKTAKLFGAVRARRRRQTARQAPRRGPGAWQRPH